MAKRIKSTMLFQSAKITLFIVFSLCLTFSPLVYTQSSYLYPRSDMSNSLGKKDDSYPDKVSYPTLSILPEKESFTALEIMQSLFRWYRNSKRLLGGGLNVLVLSMFDYKLFKYTFLSSYRITNKHTSIIAILLGGHAPPVTCQIERVMRLKFS